MTILLSVLGLVFLLPRVSSEQLVNGDIKQSSIVSMTDDVYDSYGARFAIDGKYPRAQTESPEACNCCSIAAGNKIPWWTIDFRQVRMIGGINITGRQDSNFQQSVNLMILISNTSLPPASWQSTAPVWTISDQGYFFENMFQQPRLFRYMTITSLNQARQVMTICEVDFIITACQPGSYGDMCAVTCGHCNGITHTCVDTNGTCPSGCLPGFDYTKDTTCNTECNAGQFGAGCEERCGNCINSSTACLVINGTCPNGCAPGYNNTADRTCKTACQDRRFGTNCNETCGHCINDNVCNTTDGTCPAGCAPGYNHHEDRRCKTACQDRRFGTNCNETCGHCINGNVCNTIDGKCPTGCDPGYNYDKDRRCKTACQDRRFGTNCNETCGDCINGNVCNTTDGKCPTGCDPGYNYDKDRRCKTECQDRRFGMNCNETCGHCINGHVCNTTDGTCPTGCDPGYNYDEDRRCKTACKDRRFGTNCNETCGHCINGNVCNTTDGACPAGCDPGYNHDEDKMCKTECKSGYYGFNCNNHCRNCKLGPICEFDDGACPTGCAPGYNHSAGLTCHLECANGTYGQNCSRQCGSCRVGRTLCIKTNGYCPQGECAEGFTGETCDMEIPDVAALSVGVVLGVVVLVITIVVVALILKRRGLLPKRKAEGTSGRVDSEFVNLEAFAKERGQLTKKAGIAATGDEHNTSHGGGYYSFSPDDHVTNSIKIRDLWNYITNSRENNFENLFEEFTAVPGGSQFECFAAQRDENVGKNKYRNMYPYDHCRVKLKVIDGQTDYINASHVDGYERVKKFIAAQGPQKGTIEDFWMMVWQKGVRKVVMLTNIFEMGKDKCEQYWPNDGSSILYGAIEVTSKETTEKSDYIIRKFELRMEHEKVKRVEQFHFKSWPDKDVPDSAWCLVNFWRVALNKDRGQHPIVVHCSAGIGRTGTFIALDSLYHQAMTEGGIRPVSVIETLRRQRINMVQTKYQYAFLHEALAEALLVGTHFYWASQLPSVCNFFRGSNPESSVTRAHEQYKLICDCIESPRGQQQSSSAAAAENIYEETGEPMVEPEYGNISTLQSEISEYRPKIKDRSSASIQQMNAIYLPNYAKASTYILAETPSDSSLPYFWSLVEEQNVTTIINLTETTHPFFQTSCTLGANGGKPVGRFVVNVVKEVNHKGYTIRSIVYTEQDKKENNAGFTVKMFSLYGWQQGSQCPNDLNSLMALLEEVNKWHPYVSEAKPVLFICGDGRTRCGLVAAILNESQRMRNEEGHVNIVETVMMMKSRSGDIISAEQFQFLYEAVFAYAQRMGYVLDTCDYNNV